MTTESLGNRTHDGPGSWVPVESGVRIFVQDWGRGRPIVLVAGYPYSHLTWEYNVPALLAAGFRVIALDLRGFGRSDKPYGGNDYETWAADVAGVLDVLDLQDVTLVGHSLGAAVCVQLVGGRREQRVTRLALLACPVPCLAASGGAVRAIDGWFRMLARDRPAFLDLFATLAFFNPSPQFTSWAAGDGLQASWRACVSGFEEMRDHDLSDAAANVRIPTRLLWGVHDNIVTRPLIAAQSALIEQAELVEFRTSGHGLHYDESNSVNRVLAEFASSPLSQGD